MKLIRNKKANVFFGVIIAIVVYFFGVLFIPYIYDTQISTQADLNCSLGSISYGNMLTCLIVGFGNPYFIWFICSLALGYILGSIK